VNIAKDDWPCKSYRHLPHPCTDWHRGWIVGVKSFSLIVDIGADRRSVSRGGVGVPAARSSLRPARNKAKGGRAMGTILIIVVLILLLGGGGGYYGYSRYGGTGLGGVLGLVLIVVVVLWLLGRLHTA